MTTQNDHEKKIDINISKLLEKVPNRFLLCVAASRRARQIKDLLHQSGVLEEVPSMPVLEALEEIMDGRTVVTMKPKSLSDEVLDAALATPQSAGILSGDSAPKEDKKTREKSKSKSKSLAA